MVIGLTLTALAPRLERDRLFWYPDGIAQRVAAEPEPKILRWDDATGVRIGFDTDENSADLARCISAGANGGSA